MIRKILKKILKNYNSIKYARLIGVKVGDNCRLIGNIKYGTEPYLIEIGNHVSITAGSFICHEGAHWVLKGIDKKYSIIHLDMERLLLMIMYTLDKGVLF